MSDITNQIRLELQKNVDEKTKSSTNRFFREEVKVHGVKTTIVRKICKSFFKQVQDLPKTEIFRLCEELWQSGFIEESFIACEWSYLIHKNYQPEDFAIFEKWVANYVSNWASCDTLCNHSVGKFIEQFPDFMPRLQEWAKSENRWQRRAAAVSLIIPARKGLFLKEIKKIADLLLEDSDDLVQKGYGWMLKAASEAHQQEIFNYVQSNKKNMPRTALRYAIEKMPPELKKEAMKKDF